MPAPTWLYVCSYFVHAGPLVFDFVNVFFQFSLVCLHNNWLIPHGQSAPEDSPWGIPFFAAPWGMPRWVILHGGSSHGGSPQGGSPHGGSPIWDSPWGIPAWRIHHGNPLSGLKKNTKNHKEMKTNCGPFQRVVLSEPKRGGLIREGHQKKTRPVEPTRPFEIFKGSFCRSPCSQQKNAFCSRGVIFRQHDPLTNSTL